MADRDEAALIQHHCDLLRAALAAAQGPALVLDTPALAQPVLTTEAASLAASVVASFMEQELQSMAEGPGHYHGLVP
jgi:hypothetical protein|eukprot:scaffold12646_cov115-Isochrysis_galbana.AAC.12